MSLATGSLVSARLSRQVLVLVALVAPPLGLLFWLLANPRQNLELLVPFEHFVVVTNVSLLALAVAGLVARAAFQGERYGVLFLALGFTSMAGLFSVHGLATPGMVVHGHVEDYGGTVIGLSAYLSLFVPALFFAARYTPLAGGLEEDFHIRARLLLGLIIGALAVYAWLGMWQPRLVGSLPLSYPPLSTLMAASSVALLLFAAWRQARIYAAARLPMQGGLVVAYLWLAEAQLSMHIAPLWTLAWWEYHVLMLFAVVVALGALIMELDRRRGLERFLPSAVVEHVLSGDALRLSGQRRVVTIMFVDLRDSTALAERLPAEQVVELLNTCLGALARCIFQHGGMLDKFLGDGLMAIFGILDDASHGSEPAIRAIQEMRRALEPINQRRAESGLAPVSFGVGVHTGEVVLGAVGLPERSDYTAVGDTVNTAARLEGECKRFEVDSLVTAETVACLPDGAFALRPLGETLLRGKAEAVKVYTLEAGGERQEAGSHP